MNLKIYAKMFAHKDYLPLPDYYQKVAASLHIPRDTAKHTLISLKQEGVISYHPRPNGQLYIVPGPTPPLLKNPLFKLPNGTPYPATGKQSVPVKTKK